MTDELLSAARVSRQELRMHLIDVSDLASDIADDIAGAYGAIEYRIEAGITAYADPMLLRIVIQNLLDNAFKYSQQSSHPLVELCIEEGGFYVQDNGIGFDPAFSEKIWQPFERLLPQGQYGGTGIGLANVSRIVKRHGGEVWADSEPGKGSIFHVRLPVPAAVLA
jgi:signal transduction histidine kinase